MLSSVLVKYSFLSSLFRPEYVKHRGKDLVPLTEEDVVLDATHCTETKILHQLGPPTRFAAPTSQQEGNVNSGNGDVKKTSSDEGDSVGYDEFSTEMGSLHYDHFSSKGGDSLTYDEFDSVTGSLDYNSFSSEGGELDAVNDGNKCGSLKISCDNCHSDDDELGAAYDVFNGGYGAFSDIIHDDVMTKNRNEGHFHNVDTNSDTTSESHPPLTSKNIDFYSNSTLTSQGASTTASRTLNIDADSWVPKPLSSGMMILEHL
jgi:hypothetical protein